MAPGLVDRRCVLGPRGKQAAGGGGFFDITGGGRTASLFVHKGATYTGTTTLTVVTCRRPSSSPAS